MNVVSNRTIAASPAEVPSPATPPAAEHACRSTSSASPENTRYHHLDAVRAFALLLGVVFHAAESFGPQNFYWAIVDRSTSQFLESFRFACHSFRLELFFVIAGFFARLMLMRRGTAGFARNRVQRILLPFLAGWVILYPLLVLIWLWGRSVSGNMADLGIPPEARNWPVWALWLGFFMTGGFLQKFDLTHLWFLHQLLVLYGLLLFGRWLTAQIDTRGRGIARLDQFFLKTMASRLAVVWFAVASTPLLLLMDSWTVDTPKESLIPHLPTTLLFGFCFLVGWLLHRRPELLQPLRARWRWLLVAGIAFSVAFAFRDEWVHFRQMTPNQLRWARVGFAVAYSGMMWAFVLGFLGMFTRYFSQSSATTRYVADSSYWIYITHLPLVVAVQVLVARLALPWPVKLTGILLVVFPLLFLSYHYFVRGTFIGACLNGRKYPVKWPWSGKRKRA